MDRPRHREEARRQCRVPRSLPGLPHGEGSSLAIVVKCRCSHTSVPCSRHACVTSGVPTASPASRVPSSGVACGAGPRGVAAASPSRAVSVSLFFPVHTVGTFLNVHTSFLRVACWKTPQSGLFGSRGLPFTCGWLVLWCPCPVSLGHLLPPQGLPEFSHLPGFSCFRKTGVWTDHIALDTRASVISFP